MDRGYRGRGSGGFRGSRGSGGFRGGEGRPAPNTEQRGGDNFQRGGGNFQRGGGNFQRGRGFQHAGGDRTDPGFSSYPESQTYELVKKSEVSPGTAGRKVELLANFFPIQVKKDQMVYHYDIIFAFKDPRPRQPSGDEPHAAKDLEREIKFFVVNGNKIFQEFLNKNPNLKKQIHVYDGVKNLYTLNPVDVSNLSKEVECIVKGRTKKFVVDLKLVLKIDLGLISNFYQNRCNEIPENIFRFIDLLFQCITSTKYCIHSNKFFDTTKVMDARQGPSFVAFLSGFSDHIRATEIGLAINIHLKTSTILNPAIENLLDLVLKISGRRSVREIVNQDFPRINHIIKGLKCFTTHGQCRREYSIRCLVNDRPNEKTIPSREGEASSTIRDYFLIRYQIKVGDFPLVNMSGGKDLYVPLELCFLPSHQFLHNSKLDAMMQNDMLSYATKKPIVYMNTVARFADKVLGIDKPKLAEFGVHYSPKPVRFFGRVLDAPRQKGSKRNNEPFFKTNGQPEWTLYSFDRQFQKQDFPRFIEELVKAARSVNLGLGKCLPGSFVNINSCKDILDLFQKIVQQFPRCQLVFIVLPPGDPQLYSMVKHCGDQKFGIVTQCLQGSKVKNIRGGYFDNLLLKVNGKLGGINSVIDESCLKQLPINVAKTMVVGIDVNHPSETEKLDTSIAAAVGSYNSNFTLYSASIRIQKKNREEIIYSLKDMITELLEEFKKENRFYPDNLIVFRDGVSEGQFQHAKEEIDQIRDSIRKSNRNCKMVFVVTQKRHSTRFVLVNPERAGRQESYNVPAGTVVDHTIVEPSQQIFYINSHFSPLGTSKPLKYIVLENDFGPKTLPSDQLQKLCFYCCHNCSRFRGGPIALPTALRYADLCAYRSKLHIELQVKLSPRLAPDVEKIIRDLNERIKIDPKIKNTLFYC